MQAWARVREQNKRIWRALAWVVFLLFTPFTFQRKAFIHGAKAGKGWSCNCFPLFTQGAGDENLDQGRGPSGLGCTAQDFSDRRAKAAVATARRRTAVQVREHLHSRMRSDLKSPKPYTLNQLKYVPASAKKLAAAIGFNIVGIQDIQGRVLQY